MDVIISLIAVIGLPCTCVSNHHTVHLKDLQFLFANYHPPPTKLENPELTMSLSRVSLLHFYLVSIPFCARLEVRGRSPKRGPFRMGQCVSQSFLLSPGYAVNSQKSRLNPSSFLRLWMAQGHRPSLTCTPSCSGSLGHPHSLTLTGLGTGVGNTWSWVS